MFDVSVKLVKVVLDSLLLGDEDVVNHIVSVENISHGSINFLLESDDFTVMLVGTAAEGFNEFGKFFVEVIDKLIDSVE